MFPFEVDTTSDVPLWVQLRQRLIYLINSGYFKPGDQLPTVRGLASDISINYNTVNKVYQDLERDGYICSQRGRGTFVTDLKNVKLSAVDQDVEAMAIDFVQQALAKGMTSEDIHDLVSEQLILLGSSI